MISDLPADPPCGTLPTTQNPALRFSQLSVNWSGGLCRCRGPLYSPPQDDHVYSGFVLQTDWVTM